MVPYALGYALDKGVPVFALLSDGVRFGMGIIKGNMASSLAYSHKLHS